LEDYDEKTSRIENQDIKKSDLETCQTVVPEFVSNGFWCLSFEFSISTSEIQILDNPDFKNHKIKNLKIENIKILARKLVKLMSLSSFRMVFGV